MITMQHTNDKRLALQERAVEQLEAWYEREMDSLDSRFISTDMTQAEYDAELKALERAYNEDYADIFAG